MIIICVVSIIVFIVCIILLCVIAKSTKIKSKGIKLVVDVLIALVSLIFTIVSGYSACITFIIGDGNTVNSGNTYNNFSINEQNIDEHMLAVSKILSAIGGEDYEKVAELLQLDCVETDPVLITYKAYMYENGIYFKEDIEKAEKFYDQAVAIDYDKALVLELKMFLVNHIYDKAVSSIIEGVNRKNEVIISYLKQYIDVEDFLNLEYEDQIKFVEEKMYMWIYKGNESSNMPMANTPRYKFESTGRTSEYIKTQNIDIPSKIVKYNYKVYENIPQNKEMLEVDVTEDIKV